MTDAERERLIEVMARGAYEAHPIRVAKDEYLSWDDLHEEGRDDYRRTQRQVIAAAEWAGFRIERID